MLPEPESARFQSVSDGDGHVCGEVNSKAPGAGYTGYRRFVHSKATGATRLDPQEAPVLAGPPAAGCAKPVSYQTVDERLSCAAAPAGEASANLQSKFEELWLSNCQ